MVQRLAAGDAALVRAIVELAGHLELETIAEGLEQDAEATTLLSLGCRFGQGYLFSKPVFSDGALDLIHQSLGHPARSS